jgi:hypothetical protein
VLSLVASPPQRELTQPGSMLGTTLDHCETLGSACMQVSHVLYNQLKLTPTPGAQRLKSGGWSSRVSKAGAVACWTAACRCFVRQRRHLT